MVALTDGSQVAVIRCLGFEGNMAGF